MLPSVRLDMFGRLIGIRKTGGEGGKVLRNTFFIPAAKSAEPKSCRLRGAVGGEARVPGACPRPARLPPQQYLAVGLSSLSISVECICLQQQRQQRVKQVRS